MRHRTRCLVTAAPDDGSHMLEKLSLQQALEGAQWQWQPYDVLSQPCLSLCLSVCLFLCVFILFFQLYDFLLNWNYTCIISFIWFYLHISGSDMWTTFYYTQTFTIPEVYWVSYCLMIGSMQIFYSLDAHGTVPVHSSSSSSSPEFIWTGLN